MIIIEDVIFYFVMLHNGDWSKIYRSILVKEKVDLNKLEEFKIHNKRKYITLFSPLYPECLKKAYNPPYLLFYEGDINLLKSIKKIAVIGSRKANNYGLKATAKLVDELVDNDYCIVSGLAKGIDSCAHRTCLNNHGKTIAIIGNGIDQIYPAINQDLYEQIAKEGLILSEYPDGVSPSKDKFPTRNRIIAGLSDSILVTQAFEHSGSLITVRYGLEFGKDIFCVPSRIDEHSICNKLIQEGAMLVEKVSDIAE